MGTTLNASSSTLPQTAGGVAFRVPETEPAHARKPVLAILADHPVQHFCPLYKELARNESIDTVVIFANLKGAEAYFDEDLKEEISWGSGILDAAGRCADRALLWAVPISELRRSAAVIEAGAQAGREAAGPRPQLIWAPLMDHGGRSREQVQTIAAYSVLNSRPEVQAHWGLDGISSDRSDTAAQRPLRNQSHTIGPGCGATARCPR